MLLQLFTVFAKIGAFTLGGGYAMVPLIQNEVVERRKWLDKDEFVDILAVAQSTPGALALNTATFIGYKKKGVAGAAAAILGAILPSFFIILVVAIFFTRLMDNAVIQQAFLGIRPAVAALITFSVYKIAKSSKITLPWYLLAAVAAGLVIFLQVKAIYIILGSGVVGAVVGLIVPLLKKKGVLTMAEIISLFLTFAKIGAFSIGGGYAMLPFIQDEVIRSHGWMTLREFSDVLAISQMTPGPIAVNSATYVGYKVAGFWGSFAATVGVALPSFLMILLIAMFFKTLYEKKMTKNVFKGIRPAVVGLIAAAAYGVIVECLVNTAGVVDLKAVLIFAAAFGSLFIKKVDPIYVIIASAVVGILAY